ncbi:MAG: HAD-IIIA family hydrolase [Chromatocurvus sp.]
MPDLHGIALEAIAVDLDGTLVDSLPDLARAANHTLSRRGLSPLHEDEVRGMIGDGIDTLLYRCLQRSLGRDPERRELEEAIPVMRGHYADHVFEHSCIYPGVLEALADWQGRGIRLACVTNKASVLTRPLLQGAGLQAFFESVQCADYSAERKPAPTMLLRLLAEFAIDPTRCAMIGDSTHDIGAARAAGMIAVGVDYGYGNPHGEPRIAPDVTLSRLDQLRL